MREIWIRAQGSEIGLLEDILGVLRADRSHEEGVHVIPVLSVEELERRKVFEKSPITRTQSALGCYTWLLERMQTENCNSLI